MAPPSSNGARNGAPSSSSSSSRPAHSLSRAFGDSDSDSDDGGRYHGSSRRGRGQEEALVGYSTSGALKVRRSPPPKGPKVIAPVESSGNWWEIRQKRLGLERSHAAELGGLVTMRAPGKTADGVAPTIEESRRTAPSGPERINDGEQKRGLEIRRRATPPPGEERDEKQEEATEEPVQLHEEEETLDDDERARRALLSGEAIGQSNSSLSSTKRTITIDETQALRIDAASRPAEPTLADYEAMPIHEFGAALLRGMGWKEGMGAGRNRDGPTTAPEVKKRGHLLGLGAKERAKPAGSIGLGGSKGSKRPNEREQARRYVPVVKRDRGEEGEGGRRPGSANNEEERSVTTRRRRERSRSPRGRDDRDRRRESSYRDERRDHRESSRRYGDRDGERRRDERRERDRNGERDRERESSSRRHRDDRDREREERHR